MIIKNIFDLPLESVTAHQGQGSIRFSRVFDAKEFESSWHFVDYAIVPPNCSIGEHRHGTNEELYFILEGNGIMRINDEDYEVEAGDLVLNRSGWKHSLRNESAHAIRILVIEVGIPRSITHASKKAVGKN